MISEFRYRRQALLERFRIYAVYQCILLLIHGSGGVAGLFL
jgi:hypothetical protein